MLKKELRLKYKALRKALSENDIESMSLEIANQALSLPIWDKTYFHIFLYSDNLGFRRILTQHPIRNLLFQKLFQKLYFQF